MILKYFTCIIYSCTTYLSFNLYRVQLFIDRCLKTTQRLLTRPQTLLQLTLVTDLYILQGRRITDLAYFAKMLQQGCAGCEEPLQVGGCQGRS